MESAWISRESLYVEKKRNDSTSFVRVRIFVREDIDTIEDAGVRFPSDAFELYARACYFFHFCSGKCMCMYDFKFMRDQHIHGC